MKKSLLISGLILFLVSCLQAKTDTARIQLDIRDGIENAVHNELFGVFFEYWHTRVNSKIGVSAQEFEDRGFDTDANGMDWEKGQYWQLYNTCSIDSIKENKVWYWGYNKQGLRHYSLEKLTNLGEAGYQQWVILDSGKTHDFYVHTNGNADSLYFRLSLRDCNNSDDCIIIDTCLGAVSAEPYWKKMSLSIPPFQTQNQYLVTLYIKSKGKINFDEASLMATDNKYTLRKEFFDFIKELKPKFMRFPGGSFADYPNWHFEKSIGDRDQRLAPNYKWDATIQRMDFSLDEFLQLCEELDIEPYLTSNFQNGTAEEAANMVEYCNGDTTTKYGKMRAKNGHPGPYNIRYFEIGNEQWPIYSPNYLTGYIDFYKKVKAKDPNLIIFVNGYHWAGASDLTRIFSVIGDKADFYSWHPGYAVYPQDSIKYEDEYYAFACGSYNTQHDIDFIMKELVKYGENIKQAPTEYWTQFMGLDNWALDTAHKGFSLLSAIGDVNFLHTFIRNYQTTGPALRPLFLTFYREDTTAKGKRVYFMSPSYYALKLIFNHHGQDYIPFQYFGNTINPKPEFKINFYKNMPLLDIVATKSNDSLYLSILNRHLTDTLETILDLNGYQIKENFLHYELFANHIHDHNSVDNPINVLPTIQTKIGKRRITLKPHSYNLLAIPLTDFDFTIGVEEDSVTKSSVSLFPNPVVSELNLLSEETIIDIEIIDIDGKEVTKFEDINSTYVILDFSELVNGAYYAKIRTSSRTFTEKFIIKK